MTNFRGIYWEVERDTLIAIPLFIFMGIMLQRSKIAEDLLVTMAQLFGPIPGGLGISVVFVGALLAATTGIVGATVVAMGLISLPAMLRNNYSRFAGHRHDCRLRNAGSDHPAVHRADHPCRPIRQRRRSGRHVALRYYKADNGRFLDAERVRGDPSTSAGDMFMGALFPGLVLVGVYMIYILVSACSETLGRASVPVSTAISTASSS